jgi:hypothetical protein
VVLNKADLEADPSALCGDGVRGGGRDRGRGGQRADRQRNGGPLPGVTPGRNRRVYWHLGGGQEQPDQPALRQEIQPTLEVREHDAKGRHSTTWRELIPLPGGAVVVDTPGMREFQIWMAMRVWRGLSRGGRTGLELSFRGCSHQKEPRCAVLQAVHEGRLARDRYAAYLKLKRELDYLSRERREHTFPGPSHPHATPSAWPGNRQLQGSLARRGGCLITATHPHHTVASFGISANFRQTPSGISSPRPGHPRRRPPVRQGWHGACAGHSPPRNRLPPRKRLSLCCLE